MKGIAFRQSMSTRKLNSGIVMNFIVNPIKSGIFGFSAFFSILLVTKLLSYLIGTNDTFSVGLDDVLLSVIGFILVFLIKFLENFKQDES